MKIHISFYKLCLPFIIGACFVHACYANEQTHKIDSLKKMFITQKQILLLLNHYMNSEELIAEQTLTQHFGG